MIPMGKYNAYIGDFHTHWYWDVENPTLLIAGMRSLGADFITLCYQWSYDEIEKMLSFIADYEVPLRIFPGKELTFAAGHVVCLVDRLFKPADYSDAVPFSENLRKMKDSASLVILAHPDTNWSSAYDGSYAPLAGLCRAGLVDAVQVQHPESFLALKDAGLRISPLGGFDIHACGQLTEKHPLAFNSSFSALKHFSPCSPYLSIVMAENSEESSIISAVKNGRAAAFNLEKEEILGPPELVEELFAGNFYEKWRNSCRENDYLPVEGRVLAGEKARLKIKGAKRILFQSARIDVPAEYRSDDGVFDIRNVEDALPRDSYYAPLSVESEKYTGFLGILVERSLLLETTTSVKNSVPFVEFSILNRTSKKQDFELKLFLESLKISRTVTLSVPPESSFLHQIPLPEILKWGETFSSEISVYSSSLNFKEKKILSFPVCRRIEESGTPWNIDEKYAIVFSSSSLDRKEFWNGPSDLGGIMNLSYDDDFFYLYAEISDDTHFQRWSGWETFWGDCIQFAFQSGVNKQDAYGSNYEFAIALTEKGPETFLWNAPGQGQVRRLCDAAELEVDRDETSKITVYKLSLPWSELSGFKAAPGERFLFSALLLDNDGDIVRRKWMYYGENIAVRKSMANAHCVTLE
ncbi:MAG: hypothetical protein A2020_00480 [Lentisphaerae bacterium GWF2_45_14]|nr:MAG: hypothetical protein A2020_00480 [Lentisphaerae bacterium GWF2_45_14]